MKKGQFKRQANFVKDKGQNALIKLIFSRVMLTAILMIVQIIFWIWIFGKMGAYSKWVLYSFNILAAVLVVIIINSDENPAFKMTWMLPLCLVPFFGAMLYLFIQVNPARMGMKKGLHRIRLKSWIITKKHLSGTGYAIIT